MGFSVFLGFLTETLLHIDQMSFLVKVVECLVKHGTMEPKLMFEVPLTHISMLGVVGVFDEGGSNKVI